ncbi:hypothetical protein R6Z07F_002477 [Ovis aries]
MPPATPTPVPSSTENNFEISLCTASKWRPGAPFGEDGGPVGGNISAGDPPFTQAALEVVPCLTAGSAGPQKQAALTTALVPSLGIKLLSSRSYLQRHHLLPPPLPPPRPQPPSPSSGWGFAAAAQAPPVLRPHPLLPTLPPLVTRAGAEPAGWRGRAPGVSARARRQLGAPSPPTPTGAHARRASTKQPGGVLHAQPLKRPSPRAGGREGLYSLSLPVAPQLGQPRPGVHGLRRSSRGIPPAFASPQGVGNVAASPRGLTGISTLFGGSPEGPRFPQQQLRPTFARRNRPPCRTSNPGRRVGS